MICYLQLASKIGLPITRHSYPEENSSALHWHARLPAVHPSCWPMSQPGTSIAQREALSWGRVVRSPQLVASPRFRCDLPALITAHPGSSVLPVGLMRSYGDSVLNSVGGLVSMCSLDRFIEFDAAAGTLRAEAGASLPQF